MRFADCEHGRAVEALEKYSDIYEAMNSAKYEYVVEFIMETLACDRQYGIEVWSCGGRTPRFLTRNVKL